MTDKTVIQNGVPVRYVDLGDGTYAEAVSIIGISGGDFDVRNYGAVGDMIVDDTDAVQAAVDAAVAAGGGVVKGQLHRITQTIHLHHSNVVLDFGMQASGSSADESGVGWTPDVAWAPEPLFNGLIWDGDDGGTMISMTPDWTNGHPLFSALSGVGFRGNLIAGLGDVTAKAAGIGLYLAGVTESNFEHINGYEFKTAGVKLFAENRVNGTFSPCVYQNHFGKITGRQVLNPGKVLDLDGGAAGVNCYYNVFDEVVVYHDMGVGIDLGWCDHNIFNAVHITRPAAAVGTAAGLRFKANTTTDNMVPKWNMFRSVSVDFTTVVSENGTTVARSAQGNIIDQYTNDQGVATTPTVGVNSTLFWNSHTKAFGVKNTGDFSLVALEFGIVNLTASQTVAQLGFGGSAGSLMTERMIVPFDCYAVGMVVRGTTLTGGHVSFFLTKAGTQETVIHPFLGPIATGAVNTHEENLVAPQNPAALIAGGTAIGVEAVTDAGFLPITNQFKVTLWLAVPIH